MKYKRLFRFTESKRKKFLLQIDDYIKEYGIDLTFKVLKCKEDYEFAIQKPKYGSHYIEKIDAFRKKYKPTFYQIFKLVYTPHLDKLVSSNDPFLNFTKGTSCLMKPFKITLKEKEER